MGNPGSLIFGMESGDRMKKKAIAKYVIIDEDDESIVSWVDNFHDAEKAAVDFTVRQDNDNIVILQISDAWRIGLPEVPLPKVRKISLEEL